GEMIWAERTLCNLESPPIERKASASIAEIADRSGQVPNRQRDGGMNRTKGELGVRDRALGCVLRREKIALEPQLLREEIQSGRVCGMAGIDCLLDAHGAANKRT